MCLFLPALAHLPLALPPFQQVFPEVFDALFRLCSDPDANVQNATAFLDRLVKVGCRQRCSASRSGGRYQLALCRPCAAAPARHVLCMQLAPPLSCPPGLLPHLQDIVAESHEFDVARFVPTLQEYLEVAHPLKRQFLLGWLG